MSETRRRRERRVLLDDYCSQLGLLLERRTTERALVVGKQEAERAAGLAEEAMHQAQEADRAKSRFLATMTHELRTPLNAIIGFSQVLQGAPRPAEVPSYAGYIHDAGSQLLGMLNGVLDLARIEAGRLQLDEQEVTLDELLNAALRPLRKEVESKSIAIMSGLLVDEPLCVDAMKMTQVLGNLLSNAVKFTPDGGTIDLDSDLTPDGELWIVVRDSGPGIAPEDIERVLQPFGQLEDHLTRQNGGLGLGLPIARALVRMHGGELTLTSAIDAGTTVEVRLPAARVHRHAVTTATA